MLRSGQSGWMMWRECWAQVFKKYMIEGDSAMYTLKGVAKLPKIKTGADTRVVSMGDNEIAITNSLWLYRFKNIETDIPVGRTLLLDRKKAVTKVESAYVFSGGISDTTLNVERLFNTERKVLIYKTELCASFPYLWLIKTFNEAVAEIGYVKPFPYFNYLWVDEIVDILGDGTEFRWYDDMIGIFSNGDVTACLRPRVFER